MTRTLTFSAALVAVALQGSVFLNAQDPLPDPVRAHAIVVETRNLWGTMDAAQIVSFLRAVAVRLTVEVQGGPFGILKKTGGTNCNGYSCDIICTGQGTRQRQWDVLGDAGPGGRQTPRWDGPLPQIAIRECEFGTTIPPPPPPPPDECAVCEAGRAALRLDVERLNAEAAVLRGFIAEAERLRVEREQERDAARAERDAAVAERDEARRERDVAVEAFARVRCSFDWSRFACVKK